MRRSAGCCDHGGIVARAGTPTGTPAAEGDSPAGRPGNARRGSRVYKVSEAGDLIPVEVRTGIADTRFTELIGDNLQDGDALVVREFSGDKGAPGTGGPNFRMRFF